MKKSTIAWRLVGVAVVLFSAAAIVGICEAARLRLRRADAMKQVEILFLPIACCLIPCGSGVAITVGINNRLWTHILRGVCVAMLPFVTVFAVAIFGQEQTLRDGVAYWSGVLMPCVWVGFPLAVFGSLCGLRYSTRRPSIGLLAVIGVVLFWVPASLVLWPLLRWGTQFAAHLFTMVFSR